ncbi:MAG: S9 family peptidase [Flavobacteriales bacterium]|nr:S9 family peptidase [Flavobacteriales bacterium]
MIPSRKVILSAITLIMLASCGASKSNKQGLSMKPPIAAIEPYEMTIHDHTRTDNYFWLNDRENPEVIKYLEEENAYTENALADTKQLQEDLYKEMRARIKEDDESVPYKDNGYFYYTRFEEGKEYRLHCRRKDSIESPEEVFIDENELAEGHDYFSLGGIEISDDNKIAAFGIDTVSRRLYTIHFKNLETGEMYYETIPNCSGGGAWAKDNKTFFYIAKDTETLRTNRILRHELGSDVHTDVEVFKENDETFTCYAWRTKSKDYVMIGSFQTVSSEFQMLDAGNPTGKFKMIQPRERDHEYSVSHFEDKFYIVTNWNAKNFRLMETSVDKPSKENWKEVIAHRPETMLEEVEIFKNFMVVAERTNGLPELRVINQKTGDEHYLNFGEEAYTSYLGTNMDFDTEVLRYGYSSLTTPWSTLDYNMSTKEKTLLKEQEVLGDFDRTNYQTERVMVKADDGTQVPMSIVYRKGLKMDGSNPTLLYAYGSYGSSTDPYFSSVRLSLLDRGFVYAIAHIRGGQEMGRSWYEDGKLLKKKNTFTDFINCGEYLIENKYTTNNDLFAMGGSAGGLLMGAIVNMRPDLWKGVVAAVPFVDVVTTMLDESIPLTTGEYDEWGNPNEKEYYDYILSYSPYDNVEAHDYPNMLVTTGLHDSQVQYWEPAKWVAKLRVNKTDYNLLLLHTNMEAGHGGASGRFEALKETAMEYVFMFKLSGIRK